MSSVTIVLKSVDGDDAFVGSYSTEKLPMDSGDNRIAFDTTLNVPVYFHSGKWKKLSDGSEIVDNGGHFNPLQLSSLSMWLDASELESSVTNPSPPSILEDRSGNGNHGTRSGLPSVIPNHQNGLSVLRFNTRAQKYSFPQMEDIRTVFWVFNEDPAHTFKNNVSQFRFVLNDDEQYNPISPVNPHWHNGKDDDYFWSGGTNTYILNGILRVNGEAVNGRSTNIPTSLSIVSLRTVGNVRASSFGYDRAFSGRQFMGDLGELIIFNKELSDTEIEKVEVYLAHKWGLILYRSEDSSE